MGEPTAGNDDRTAEDESLVLRVDNRGRVTIPKAVRDRLGIEPGSEVPARLLGSVLTIDPKPSADLRPATAGRDDWTDSTPTDAGESLFGSMEVVMD